MRLRQKIQAVPRRDQADGALKLRALFWLLFVGVGASLLIGLGFWQLSRLQERRAQNAEIAGHLSLPPIVLTGRETPLEPLPLEYQPVAVTGVFDFSSEVTLRNRARNGAPGVHLITPLRIDGSDKAVLVDRGWIPYQFAAAEQRAVYARPTGTVTIHGLLRLSQSQPSFFLAPIDPTLSPTLPRLDAWFWLDVSRLQNQIPYPLLPFYVEQDPGPDPAALPAAAHDLDLSDGPHLSYAIQWFAFAAILVIGSLALARRKIKPLTPLF